MLKDLRELWSYRNLIRNLVVRDLKVRYKNSILGVVWSWLNPLLMMLIFTFVFGYLQRDHPIENHHILFLSALLPWNFFSGAVMGGLYSIVGNASLVKRVYFPREVLPISVVLSSLVNFLISLPVLLLLILISGMRISGWIVLLPIPILIEVIFALGIVLFLSAVEAHYRDTHMIMDVGMQAWFFLTPILYQVRVLPEQVTILNVTFDPRLWLFRLNPMASIVNTYQDLLYYGGPTSLDFLTRTAVTAGAILVLGYAFFRHQSRKFAEIV